jgi:outer membrane protein OmpA-like peptidoglycan-associated protein
MRSLAYLSLLALLAGCSGSVQRLHELNPPANDFPSALASEYMAYADSEAEMGRSGAAAHYADKGLQALKGEAVQPEMADGSLKPEQQAALAEARTQLVKFLEEDIKKVAPQKLARAQLLFDCWQHQLNKELNQEQAPCSDEYHSTMAELQEVYDALHFGKEARRTVTFAHKSAHLTTEALAVIREVAVKVKDLPHYRVELKVYAGKKLWQRHLTEARLNAVRHALVQAGVGERHIRVRKEGGAKVVVLSRDGIPINTKIVTITVKTHYQHKEP